MNDRDARQRRYERLIRGEPDAGILPVTPEEAREIVKPRPWRGPRKKLPLEPGAPDPTPQVINILPNPWLFDTEELLKELDRCRELVLKIPAPTNDVFLAQKTAVNAIWDLRETLRELLKLHREGQRAFAKKSITPGPKSKLAITPNPKISGLRRI